jgi:hypothetical protein
MVFIRPALAFTENLLRLNEFNSLDPLDHLVAQLGNAESMDRADEGQRRRRRNWVQAAGGIPGDLEDGMPSQNEQRKHGTTRGSPRPKGTARASGIAVRR